MHLKQVDGFYLLALSQDVQFFISNPLQFSNQAVF